jgi:tetratricopeptide (TPR) repeat protein
LVDGKLERAERILTQALEQLRDDPQLDPIDLALLRTDRAPVLDGLGRLDEARSELESSLAVLEGAFGREHPSVGIIHLNLSSTLMAVEAFDKARDHATRALEIEVAQVGEDSPETNRPLANLAEIERRAGNLDEALRFAARAVDVTSGADEFEYDLMLNTNNLGVIYLELGRLDDAQAQLRRAVELSDRVLGEHHPTSALHRGNLAETVARAGDYAEASALSDRAVADLEVALGIDLVGHPEQLEIRAEIAGYRGDHEAALTDARRLVALHRKREAPAQEIARAQAHAGMALAGLGNDAEAARELDDALSVLTTGDAGDLVAAAAVTRAELARANGEVGRARALLTGIEASLPPPTHPWAARLQDRYRVLLARVGGT